MASLRFSMESDQELKEESFSEEVKQFLSQLETCSDGGEKIEKALDFMKSRLSGSSPPRFREFWEVKRVCLPLFKENIPSKSRTELWQKYVDLSGEARRVKEILDEQSAFAYEQIDLAVQALLQDLSSYEERLSQLPDCVVLENAPCLLKRREDYCHLQKELHLLNAFAAKVNALRKELIKTEMRIRSKNKLFEKLSTCGNQIFPRRKELVQTLSQTFLEDVTGFVKRHFSEEKKGEEASLHSLREEIKALQAIAKQLTLNTRVFNETRTLLGSSWDLLKGWDLEKKKELLQKKEVQKKSYDEAMLKVQEFEALCREKNSLEEIEPSYTDGVKALRDVKDLGRLDLRELLQKMEECRRPFEEKNRLQRLELEKQVRQQEELRLQKLQSLQKEMESLLQGPGRLGEMGAEEAIKRKGLIEEEVKAFSLSKAEKMWVDRLLKQLKDRILEVKSAKILSLSQSDQETCEALKQLIAEKKERRVEIKEQLESYRKALGGSGFDFEKGMMYRELMEADKKSLEKIEVAIEELCHQLDQIKGS